MANKKSISAARLAANRANAQKSTGPRTAEGKARSSVNAVRNGLTGRTVLIPSDDEAAYRRHVQKLYYDYHPVTLRERYLVQAIIDTQWRLERIPGLESGLIAIGMEECKDLYQDKDPLTRQTMREAKAYELKAQAIKNLQMQETRLRRRLALDLRELEKTQHERKWDQIKEAKRRHEAGEPPLLSEEYGDNPGCYCGQCEALDEDQVEQSKPNTSSLASNLQNEKEEGK